MNIIHNFAQICGLTGLVLTSLLTSIHPVAAQRTCVVTDNGDVVCGRLQQSSKNPDSEKNQTVEFENIDITLQGCRRSKSTVNCHFLFTAKKDGFGSLYCNHTKIFDFYGKEYFCQQGQIGEAKGGNEIYAHTRVLKGIPLKAVFTFREIPTQVKEIAALEVGVNFDNGGGISVIPDRATFRSIQVSE